MQDLRPIGVFDSGVGGLSVLRALQAELPMERFVYVADNAYAPYGERDDEMLRTRSHAIVDSLHGDHGIKALVVACNTATAAAIHTLRAAYQQLPIVGIEPALKPAASLTRTGQVGVMATRGTLNSAKFQKLLDSLHGQATFVLQPCDGLADAIERLQPCDGLADAIERFDEARIRQLCLQYTVAMGPFGTAQGQMDCLVLGCTHYPFVADTLQTAIGQPAVPMLEGGVPVARQTRRLLLEQQLLVETADTKQSPPAQTQYFSTGNIALLETAVQRWLHTASAVRPLATA